MCGWNKGELNRTSLGEHRTSSIIIRWTSSKNNNSSHKPPYTISFLSKHSTPRGPSAKPTSRPFAASTLDPIIRKTDKLIQIIPTYNQDFEVAFSTEIDQLKLKRTQSMNVLANKENRTPQHVAYFLYRYTYRSRSATTARSAENISQTTCRYCLDNPAHRSPHPQKKC